MSGFETFEHAGLHVELHYDESGCGDPRDCDQLAHLLCWHPDYLLGDEQFTNDEGRGALPRKDGYPDHSRSAGSFATQEAVFKHCREQGATVIMPLFLYDHSGITISAGETIEKLSREAVSTRNKSPFDAQGWDTSWVGFAYTTEEKRKSLGVKRSRAEIDRQIRAEIEEYDKYLRGEVYGYVIKDEYDQHLDSLWGMLGYSYASEEARRAADYEATRKQGTELNRLPVAA